MLELTPELEVHVCLGYTDMRSGFDRLRSKVSQELSKDVLSEGVYVFLSRSRDRVKLLYWDGDGLVLWYKRLEAGVFRVVRSDGYEEITGIDLKSLLSGIELKRIKFQNKMKKSISS